MAWRVAQSLSVLRNQINAAFPNRSKVSDGTIGDAAHAAGSSDHNPNAAGVVCALDITTDLGNGQSAHDLADRLVLNRDPDLKYIISNRRIAGAWTNWKWSVYSGSDPHVNHIHISVGVGNDGQSTPPYDDTQSWGGVGAINSTPSTPAPAAPTVSNSQAQTVTLPSDVASWAVYKVGSAYRKGTPDQVGSLAPSKFGGLTYNIVENRGNVVVIDTRDYGRVAIWVQGTSAQFGGAAPIATPSAGGQTVTFPASVASWAVYKLGSGARKGTADQVGSLAPSKFGGLSYPVLGYEDGGNTVIIQTQDYGKVKAWIKDTSAVIR